MNIAFFLMPKAEVAYMPIKSTMRQALERMEYHRFTAVPLIDENGRYVGTLTEGDLLWKMKELDVFSVRGLEDIPLSEVDRHFQHEAVSVHEDIEALLSIALEQSFVPIVDDKGIFIGIVTRKAIISYFAREYLAKNTLRSLIREEDS